MLNQLQAVSLPPYKILNKSVGCWHSFSHLPKAAWCRQLCVNWAAACFSLPAFPFLQTAEPAVPVDPRGSQHSNRKLGSIVRSMNQRSFRESVAGCGPAERRWRWPWRASFFLFTFLKTFSLVCSSLAYFLQGLLSPSQLKLHKSSSLCKHQT